MSLLLELQAEFDAWERASDEDMARFDTQGGHHVKESADENLPPYLGRLMSHRSEIAPDAMLEVRVYEPDAAPEISAKNAAAIALLNQWIAEEATNDPEEIRKADAEVEELMENLNRNRIESGESPLFS